MPLSIRRGWNKVVFFEGGRGFASSTKMVLDEGKKGINLS